MVPDELALELGELDLGIVELTGDPRTPEFLKEAELMGDVHDLYFGLHSAIPPSRAEWRTPPATESCRTG
jgi:hypothetical protein